MSDKGKHRRAGTKRRGHSCWASFPPGINKTSREWKSEGGTQQYTVWDRKRGSSIFHPLLSQLAVTKPPPHHPPATVCVCVCDYVLVCEELIHSPVWEGKGLCRHCEGVCPPLEPRNVFAALEEEMWEIWVPCPSHSTMMSCCTA